MDIAKNAAQRERREAGPLTSRGRNRREEILMAARRCFEVRGYADTRVADIAAEASAATGTFYTYFPDKETVFAEIADTVVEEVYASMHVPVSSEGVYETCLEVHRRFIDAYRRNASIIALIDTQAAVNDEMRDLRLRLRESFVGPGARGIAQFQTMGVADPDLDPRLTMEAISSMSNEYCRQWFTLGRALADEETMVRLLTRLWLRAIGVPLTEIPR